MALFFIKILETKRQQIWGLPSCIGEITLNNFKETFVMPLEWWHQKDYKQQWLEGLERIFTHKRSCLITSVQNPYLRPHINWWILYKEGDTIFIQNQIIFGSLYRQKMKHNPFDSKTCYRHLPKKRSIYTDGEKISEWRVSLQDIQIFLEEFKKTAPRRRMQFR